jgi:hypothetical protein
VAAGPAVAVPVYAKTELVSATASELLEAPAESDVVVRPQPATARPIPSAATATMRRRERRTASIIFLDGSIGWMVPGSSMSSRFVGRDIPLGRAKCGDLP